MDYWRWETHGAGLGLDEVCILVQQGVSLYNGHEKTEWQKGNLSLTTHHLRYNAITDAATILQLPLELIKSSGQAPSISAGFGPFSSAKIIVPLPQNAFVKLSFRAGGVNAFYAALISALDKKAWMRTKATTSVTNGRSSSSGAGPAVATTGPNTNAPLAAPRGVGIAGVQQASAQSAAMGETFKDIDDIMSKASSIVKNIRRLRERNEAAAAGVDPGGALDVERTKIESIEATLGLGVMVTRSNQTGSYSAFHRDLAVELHAWMTHPSNSKRFNDMPVVPLIELFALYNKARGGDLVSPLDVLNACTYMTTKLPSNCYDLTTLRSGRKALVNRDDSLLLAKLATLLGPQLVNAQGSPVQDQWKTSQEQQQRGDSSVSPRVRVPTSNIFPKSSWELKSVSDISLAEKLQVSVEVATDILTMLTLKGFLCCVDTGFDCFVYAWNIFVF